MADSAVVSRYRQYKAGTIKLVNWLANTARRCEDVTAIVPSLRAARDSAKQAKRKQKDPTPLDTTVTLTTSQLIGLAQVVAKAAVDIPDDIIWTTKAVIAGRKVSADSYASYTNPADVAQHEQNQTHKHFITVLGEVLRLLETSPGFAAPKKPKPSNQSSVNAPEKPGKHDDSISNMFSYLNIYEPMDSAPGPTPSTKSMTSNTPASNFKACKPMMSKVVFELEEQDGDRSFAVWCLLYDLRGLRQEVRTQWLRYRDGEISFSAVAEMTANAMMMTQYAEVEFIHQYPDIDTYEAILNHLQLNIAAIGPNVWIYPSGSNGVAEVSSGRLCAKSVAEGSVRVHT